MTTAASDNALTLVPVDCVYPHDDPAPEVHPTAEFLVQYHNGKWAGVCGDDLYAWCDASRRRGLAQAIVVIPLPIPPREEVRSGE